MGMEARRDWAMPDSDGEETQRCRRRRRRCKREREERRNRKSTNGGTENECVYLKRVDVHVARRVERAEQQEAAQAQMARWRRDCFRAGRRIAINLRIKASKIKAISSSPASSVSHLFLSLCPSRTPFPDSSVDSHRPSSLNCESGAPGGEDKIRMTLSLDRYDYCGLTT
uniref:Uncharacterized protein n=1 Tax=Oryza rufipogon TaxID=4529 RepID=A0A0E0P6M7_ORYRU